MGLKPVIYRHATHVVNKRGAVRVGYTGGVANPQYDYDHRQDSALFLMGILFSENFVLCRPPMRSTENWQKYMASGLH